MRTGYLGSGSGIVSSVFGRIGAVVAALNDYAASLIQNDSSVAGATVKDALNAVLAAVPTVSSVFTRGGAVVATLGDYVASLIANDSNIGGIQVKSSLDTLLTLAVSNWAYHNTRGLGSNQASVLQYYIPRKNDNATLDFTQSEYPVYSAGTFTFTVTWRICQTPLAIDSMIVQLFKNGVATGVLGTILPGAVTGQFSGAITVAVGDGISMGLLQSGTELQTNWNLATETTAL